MTDLAYDKFYPGMIKTAKKIGKIMEGKIEVQVEPEGKKESHGRHKTPHVHLHYKNHIEHFASISIPTLQNPIPQVVAGAANADIQKAIAEWFTDQDNRQKALNGYKGIWQTTMPSQHA